MKKYSFVILFICGVFFFNGCSVLKVAKGTVVTSGKISLAAAKTAGKVVTGTGRGIKALIDIPFGRTVVKLKKRGSSFLVNSVLNRKIKAKLLLDTGCTDTQISADVAKKMGIDTTKGTQVLCNLADGNVVKGRAVNIKELRVGRARIRNVRAIVLDVDRTKGYDGLLGMSFLDNFNFKIDTDKNELVLRKK